MKISGNIICEKCKNNIEWEYIVPQHISSKQLQVEIINSELHHPNKVKRIDNTKYIFNVRCKKCDTQNFFEIESDTYL